MCWQAKFLSNTHRLTFQLRLSTMMMEFLAAVAGDCEWDRSSYGRQAGFNPYPCNFIGASRYLLDRGLIEEKPLLTAHRQRENKRQAKAKKKGDLFLWDHDDFNNAIGGKGCNQYRLTPAGEKVVELFKVAGMFREQAKSKNRKA